MVQLSLLPDDVVTLSRQLDEIETRVARRTSGCEHVAAARRATESRFRSWGSRVLTERESARVRAYFAAVLRRRVLSMRDEGAREARRRLVARSIQDDLVAAGWDPAHARREAWRTVGDATYRTDAA
jgi:phage tail sheath protein FI